MKVAVIAGSHRAESESARVGKFVEKVLIGMGSTTYFLSLGENPLPLWDEGVWSGDDRWKTLWGPISSELKSCEAVVVISPEWGGMVPAGLKNFFLLCGSGELAHKPGMIVSVSSSLGGSYPVNELRTSSYKNTRICYTPDHVIVRNVGSMLKGDTPSDDHDKSLRERIAYSLQVLIEYGKGLKVVRESGVLNYERFPYGM